MATGGYNDVEKVIVEQDPLLNIDVEKVAVEQDPLLNSDEESSSDSGLSDRDGAEWDLNKDTVLLQTITEMEQKKDIVALENAMSVANTRATNEMKVYMHIKGIVEKIKKQNKGNTDKIKVICNYDKKDYKVMVEPDGTYKSIRETWWMNHTKALKDYGFTKGTLVTQCFIKGEFNNKDLSETLNHFLGHQGGQHHLLHRPHREGAQLQEHRKGGEAVGEGLEDQGEIFIVIYHKVRDFRIVRRFQVSPS
ncbi:unnamed protein product [Effrenium voratum]|uniref:Uncharacterized protein n=1 Tax=Effrenium voratum TaxID=2562239 RepID=A0AA36N3G3_9DINO|nr:unnamed protein product [Effrenium voratum]